MGKLYKFTSTTARILIKIIWNYEIIHRERFSKLGNCIIAANHLSNFDPPLLGSTIPNEIFYLAKAELFKNKFFGAFLRKINVIPIRRGSIDRKALENAKRVLNEGNALLMFPEGTRKSTKVRSGIGKIALETHKNIVPIYLKNTDKLLKCFFRKEKIQIVIGETINIDKFHKTDNNKQDYREIAEFTMQKILELDNDCKTR